MWPTLNPSLRHAEYLEQIQQKAWELSLQKCTSDQGVPVIKPYTVAKKCEVKLSSQKCNIMFPSKCTTVLVRASYLLCYLK